MASHDGRRPVSIERRTGKLFQASKPLRLRTVVMLVIAAMVVGALLALALKHVFMVEGL